MIFDSVFFKELSNGSSPLLIKREEGGEDCVFGYIIDTIDDRFSDFFFHEPFFKSGNRFCLALQAAFIKDGLKNPPEGSLFDYLGTVLFNTQYYKINNYPIIIVLNSSNGNQKDLLDKLSVMFEYLGYDMFYYCFLDEKMEVIKTNVTSRVFAYNCQVKDFAESGLGMYFNLLEESSDSKQLLFFFLPDKISFDVICDSIKKVEEKFKKVNPMKFLLLEESIRFKREIENYEINIQILKKELNSKETYIASLNIPESTMKKVSNFYYYEYEILPRWYKQFGHVIKVIMGKRTFRSLFNDNVKKYKD